MGRVNNSAKFFQEDRVYLSWSFLEKKKVRNGNETESVVVGIN